MGSYVPNTYRPVPVHTGSGSYGLRFLVPLLVQGFPEMGSGGLGILRQNLTEIRQNLVDSRPKRCNTGNFTMCSRNSPLRSETLQRVQEAIQ